MPFWTPVPGRVEPLNEVSMQRADAGFYMKTRPRALAGRGRLQLSGWMLGWGECRGRGGPCALFPP